MNKIWFLAVFISISIGAFGMIEAMSLEELIVDAELIVSARVVEVRKTGRSIPGYDDLKIIANIVELEAIYKGKEIPKKRLTISTIAYLEDSPEFVKDQRYLLFLRKVGDSYHVCNEVQGAWPINNSGKFAGMGSGISLETIKEAITQQEKKG